MILRNRGFWLEALLGLLITAVASGIAFWLDPVWGAGVLGLCLCFLLLHLGAAWFRYQRIRRLGVDLDRLLHNGATLPIRDYQEGELSVLASQIQKMTLRLQEAAEITQAERNALADALADISHQLRTPLTAMNLTAAMLSQETLSQKRRLELTRELQGQLMRTEWLVDTLLKMSKLDAGTIQLVREPLTARQVVDRAAEPLRISLELRNQTLEVDCGSAAFQGDLTWTAEAIGNLLKNAMEHTPEGGRIRVTARETPLYTQLTVEDTGSGFASEDLPHLFERFYRGKNAAPGSFGIGLALARSVVLSQNGSIVAANTPTGAQFTIRFFKQTI